MTVGLVPLPKMQFNQNGSPVANGKLFTYAAGTTNKLVTYTDSTGNTQNTNPIILDSNGQADIWLTVNSLYKLILSPSTDTDPPTNPFWTEDNISFGLTSAAIGGQISRVVGSIAALRTLSKNVFSTATVTAYAAAGDGGGGNYYLDSNDSTSIDNGGTIIVANDGGRWKLIFQSTIDARQFGVVANGPTDAASLAANTTALQNAINYIVPLGLELTLPAGLINVNAGLNVGDNSSNFYGSFVIRGVQKRVDGVATGGTVIMTYGTGLLACIQFLKSANRTYRLENISFECNTLNGCQYGVLWPVTNFTRPTLTNINVSKATRSYGILYGVSGNGEFISFINCTGYYGTHFFFMDNLSGQSLRHVFINCGGGVGQAGGALFEVGSTVGGYGLYVVNFNSSSVTVGQTPFPATFLKCNGTSEAITFVGGRNENINTILNNSASDGDSAEIKFDNVTFPNVYSNATNPFILSTTNTNNRASPVTFDGCVFGLSPAAGGPYDYVTSIGLSDSSEYRFRRCSFQTVSGTSGLPRSAGVGGISIEDCAVTYYNGPVGTGIVIDTAKVNKAIGNIEIRELILRRKLSADSANISGGVPENLLIYPSINPTNNNNVPALAPWTNFGTSLTFAYVQAPTTIANLSSGRQARNIGFNATSGVSQIISGITMNSGLEVFYQAVVNISGNGQWRFALEDQSGNILDEWISPSSGNFDIPQAVSLMGVGLNADHPVLKIQNLASSTQALRLHWQLASLKHNASFVEPVDGSVKTLSGYWSQNTDSARIYGRLALPHKNDETGISAGGTLKDVESDLYLSSVDERLAYFANGTWWKIPRENVATTIPTTGTWTAGDFVRNSSPAIVSGKVLFGWSRLTSGSGNVSGVDWTPLYMTTT